MLHCSAIVSNLSQHSAGANGCLQFEGKQKWLELQLIIGRLMHAACRLSTACNNKKQS
jgi:hypothetical protein